MDWALADRSFILDFAGLTRLVSKLPVTVERKAPMVYALTSISQKVDQGAPLQVHALRREGKHTYIKTFNPEQE